MLIEGRFPIAAPPKVLLQHLFDVRLMASCLPGCETLELLPDDRYRTVVVVAMAGIKARFDLQVEITRKDEHNVWVVTRGEEGGNASTLQADSQVTLESTAEGTLVSYRSEVSVTGRLGRFALGMMKKKAQSLGDEFALNLRAQLERVGEQSRATAQVSAALPDPHQTPPHDSAAQAAVGPVGAGATSAVREQAPPRMSQPALAWPPRSWWQAVLKWLRGERKTSAAKTRN